MCRLSMLLIAFIWVGGAGHADEPPAELKQLVADLKSPRWAVRNRATRLLELVGPSARAVIAPLKKSNDPEQRRRAEELLAKIDRARATPAITRSKLSGKELATAKDATWITSLCLRACAGLADADLAALVKLARLSSLDLSGCRRLGDGALAHLAKLPRLRTLDLTACDKLTGAGLRQLHGLRTLRTLRLAGCPRIGAADRDRLARALPDCRITTAHPRPLALYLLADSKVAGTEVDRSTVGRLRLRAQPLLTLDDFTEYHAKTHMFGLTEKGAGKLPKAGHTSVHGVPWVLAAYDQRVYVGALWTMLSSTRPVLPTFCVERFRKGPSPFLMNQGDARVADRRGDPLILCALREAGKLK